MTVSSTVSITVKAKVRALSIWFEDDQGNQITEVMSGETFYICGYLEEDSTPLSGETIHIFEVDSSGNPQTKLGTATTGTDGTFSLEVTAPTVTSDTDYYYRAYDDEQTPW